MIRVLAFATAPPRTSALGPYVTEIVAMDGEVRMACWFDPAGAAPDCGLVEVRRIAAGQQPADATSSGRRLRWRRGRTKAGRDAADPATRRWHDATDPATRRWHDARDDPWVAHRADAADFFVALDQDAVYPVWEIARAHPGVRASFGLHAVISALSGRSTLTDGR
jgi:hypothetical protein